MSAATRVPLGYRARAMVDGAMIADSSAAVRVDVADESPELWFPRAEVDEPALGQLPASHWRAGEGDLADYVAFAAEQVEVVVIDSGPGDEDRDITLKRFPTWGDVADLIAVLDVRADADGRFVGATRGDWQRPVVEGSQILGQMIVAAGRRAPDRRVTAASMVFTRAADSREPYALELDEVQNGRTFATFGVRAVQADRTCSIGTVLVGVPSSDVIRHADPTPPAPGPYESVSFDMGVTGRDLRVVDAAYTGDPAAPAGPPEIDAWIRFRDVPPDPALHAGLLAQFTGAMSIAAALRPHEGVGQDAAHRTLSTAVNAISLTIHADVRADRWMRYHHRSTFAGDGMTHAECRVYDEAGRLLASFTNDCMVRGFADPTRPVDDRTAL